MKFVLLYKSKTVFAVAFQSDVVPGKSLEIWKSPRGNMLPQEQLYHSFPLALDLRSGRSLEAKASLDTLNDHRRFLET